MFIDCLGHSRLPSPSFSTHLSYSLFPPPCALFFFSLFYSLIFHSSFVVITLHSLLSFILFPHILILFPHSLILSFIHTWFFAIFLSFLLCEAAVVAASPTFILQSTHTLHTFFSPCSCPCECVLSTQLLTGIPSLSLCPCPGPVHAHHLLFYFLLISSLLLTPCISNQSNPSSPSQATSSFTPAPLPLLLLPSHFRPYHQEHQEHQSRTA